MQIITKTVAGIIGASIVTAGVVGGGVAANAATPTPAEPAATQSVTTTPPEDGTLHEVAEFDASELGSQDHVPAGAAGIAVELDDSGKTVTRPLTDEELRADDTEWLATDHRDGAAGGRG